MVGLFQYRHPKHRTAYMSNYSPTTPFAPKDTLPPLDPNKQLRGQEFDTEFDNISLAVNTKVEKSNGVHTGVTTVADLDVTTNIDTATLTATGAVTADSVAATGAVTADSFAGDGSALTNLALNATGFTDMESLTQAAYDALTPDANTIYFIVG
jgi:hypothetical protein